MRNLQLAHLNRSRLDALREEELYLRLEPFSLKKKKAAGLQIGDWIDLGETMPRLELARNGRRVAEVIPVEAGVIIQTLQSREETARAEYRHTVLEGRLTVLSDTPLKPEALLPLSWSAVERIYLYGKGRLQAVASLVHYDEGYALEILELADG